MASAKLPDLSPPEHTRFAVAQLLALFAANVAYLLTLGPGWNGLAAFAVAALAIFIASEAIARRWGRRNGRPLITRKEWNDARQAAQQKWVLRVIYGFAFGFAVSGGSLDSANWGQRIIGGVAFAAVWLVIPLPQSRPKDQPNQPSSL